MSKISIKSKQSVNMSHFEYMCLHRRMFAIVHDGTCRICLYTHDVKSDIYVDVTNEAFDSFLKYEMDFALMLNLFATLCIKYGTFPCPF